MNIIEIQISTLLPQSMKSRTSFSDYCSFMIVSNLNYEAILTKGRIFETLKSLCHDTVSYWSLMTRGREPNLLRVPNSHFEFRDSR